MTRLILCMLLAGCAHHAVDLPLEADAFDTRPLPEIPDPLDLASATRLSLGLAPRVDAARAQWHTAEAKLVLARQRRNPSVSVAMSLIPLYPNVSLKVPFTPPARRARKIHAAQTAANAAKLGVYAAAWLVWSDIAHALVDVALSTRRAELLAQSVELQRTALDTLTARSEAGALPVSQLMPARLRAIQMELSLDRARRDIEVARAALSAAIGVPRSALAGHRVQFDGSASIGPDAMPPDALSRRSDVLAAVETVRAADGFLRSQRAGRVPLVSLTESTQWDPTGHVWKVGLSTTIPIFNQNQGPVAQALAAREVAAARLLTIQARARANLDAAQVRVVSARARLARAQELVEDQRVAEQQVRSRLEAGAAQPIELTLQQLARVSAQVGSLSVERELRHAEVDWMAALQDPSSLQLSPSDVLP